MSHPEDAGGRPMMAWRGKTADIEKMDGGPPRGASVARHEGRLDHPEGGGRPDARRQLTPPSPGKPLPPVERGDGTYGVPNDGALLTGD